MTNKSFFETIYVDYQTENYTRRTSSSRNSLIRRHFLPRYGEFEMTATKPEHIENTCASMEEEGMAQNTVFGAYYALLSFFKLAVEKGIISESPGVAAKAVGRQ